MSLTPAGKPGTTADSFERLLAPPGRRRTAAGVAVALIGPVLATVLASIPSHRGTAVPALLYLLAVVAAAAIGHLWPALLAAALSFVGLDYYFTEPTHTFVVSKGEDLFALAVFLVVAAAVSAAISAALEQRTMAEFREQQVRALYHVTSQLLAAPGLTAVLSDLASSLRSLYGLDGCRVIVLRPDGSERERVVSGAVEDDDLLSFPLVAEGRPV